MPNFVMIPFGVFMVLAGAVVAPLPIPFGVPMIIIGSCILIARSDYAASVFRSWRARWARFDGWIMFLEERAPQIMADILRRTRPLRPS
jgi:hypothetical protein